MEKGRKVWVVMSAGSMSMRVDGVYLSEQAIVDYYQESWDTGITDYDELVDYLEDDGEIQIETSYMYNDTQVIREEKISTVLDDN